MEHPSSSHTLPAYSKGLEAHPLSDHNMVQTLNQASKGLDEELFLGVPASHLIDGKGKTNMVQTAKLQHRNSNNRHLIKRGCGGVPQLLRFNLSANLRHINIARQRKTEG